MTKSTLNDIDGVLSVLTNRREEATEHLFPGDSPGQEAYRSEWLKRDPFSYWRHLDTENQRQLVLYVRRLYSI